MKNRLILVTGGARSGKSAFAERLLCDVTARRAYIATCPVLDDEMRERVARAQRLVEAGLAGLRQFDRRLLTDACAMPRDTKEQRRARKTAVLEARALQKSAALLQKRFPEGAVVPTEADVEKAYALPETTRAERRAKRRARSAAERAMHRLTVAAAPYMAAKKLLEERDAYSRWPELEARYRQLKA